MKVACDGETEDEWAALDNCNPGAQTELRSPALSYRDRIDECQSNFVAVVPGSLERGKRSACCRHGKAFPIEIDTAADWLQPGMRN